MKITLAQLNPTVGDITGNISKLKNALTLADHDKSDLIITSELFLTGYPPLDLLTQPWFISATEQALKELQNLSEYYPDIGMIIGLPLPHPYPGKGLFNSAVLVYRGKIVSTHHKVLLPAYDVFDENRYFDPAPAVAATAFKGELLGINICEDAWNNPLLKHNTLLYKVDPIEILAAQGSSILINISASPFYAGKDQFRCQLISSHARRHHVPFIYLNQVGANDELIFDGNSMLMDENGNPAVILPGFKESIITIDTKHPVTATAFPTIDEKESIYRALVLGINDYMKKCRFNKVILGLSGGIDSALTACLACAAVGPENVLGINMPSVYSSSGSINDSRHLADNLNMQLKVIPITKVYDTYLQILSEHFQGTDSDITEENLQARIRGNYLMAFSNKFGYLLLSTGNKSEMSLGYCTLYGDMSGGLSVLADVPKTMVYELSKWINRNKEIIPKSIIEKAPSAELRHYQKDEDDLPPYEIVDKILHAYIEEAYSPKDIINLGIDPDIVHRIISLINRNEYKRRQAAPALKVTAKAFGMGRRMPIAAKIPEYE